MEWKVRKIKMKGRRGRKNERVSKENKREGNKNRERQTQVD